jgi:formylglycine-generating enzyme required for sulfatase activity
MKKQIMLVMALILGLAFTLQAQTGKKVALVIGNSAYQVDSGQARLTNPSYDADGMARALRGLGFEVIVKKDLNKDAFYEAIDSFYDRSSKAEVAIFYYSGHGLEYQKQNYLIPVDAKVDREYQVQTATVAVDHVLRTMESAGAKANILILDACRNNPFAGKFKSASWGLADQKVPEGTIAVFATAPGEKALDGKAGEMSVFTQSLIRRLTDPVSFMDMISYVASDMKRELGGKQSPYIAGILNAPLYLGITDRAGGTVLATANKAGEVWVDGVKAGRIKAQGELTIEGVAPGETEIEFRYDDGTKEAITILVSRGSTVNVKGRYSSSLPANMVYVPGGKFTMGDTAGGGYGDEKPLHEVTLSSFLMGKYEVTVGEFRAFVSDTGYKTSAELRGKSYVYTRSGWEEKAGASWKNPGFSQSEKDPVVCVSWYDAVAYCNWLSGKEGKQAAYSYEGKGRDFRSWPSGWNTETHNKISADWSANGYRLPTEAEWEYAAKGGVAKQTVAYAGSASVDVVAWYRENSGNTTHPVGQKKANALGLYDMSGNVWEWCWDWYGSYGGGSQSDPRGRSSGDYRVLRGGSWDSDSVYLRASRRGSGLPWFSCTDYGFRVVSPAPSSPTR